MTVLVRPAGLRTPISHTSLSGVSRYCNLANPPPALTHPLTGVSNVQLSVEITVGFDAVPDVETRGPTATMVPAGVTSRDDDVPLPSVAVTSHNGSDDPSTA